MAVESTVLTGLEPGAFWAHFETLTTIARPSRHEEPVIEHVRAWASGPAASSSSRTPGATSSSACPRRPAASRRPPSSSRATWTWCASATRRARTIPPRGGSCSLRDGDWLTADGTTLGADDGVAIAAMMALVEDESIPHGPLELLMTVAEEVGLEGANALDGSLLTGSTLINLDSEEDGVLTVGCAGSTDTWIRVDAPRAACSAGRGHAVGRRRRRARRPLGRPDRARARERDQGARPGAA